MAKVHQGSRSLVLVLDISKSGNDQPAVRLEFALTKSATVLATISMR